MKDNLENKVDNITKVIGNMKLEDLATKSDLNTAFNELIKSLESVNIETNEEFARKFLEAFQVSMDEKHKNLQAILNDFEKQVFEMPKSDDSKFDYEITKITSDINAIYSKMDDQEAKFEKLIKGFENISKNNPKRDFDEMRQDLDSFAKGFGNSANTIIKHFNDFMENLKEYSGKEEFNKLFDNLEILSNNTSLIISAIGIIDSKYKDMTDVVELITNNENAFGRTLEELRASKASFDDFVPNLKQLSTKEDMDIVHKQLDILNEAFVEVKKYIDSQTKNSATEKFEENQKELLANIETLQANLSALNENLISLGKSYTNDFENRGNDIKDSFSKISEQINDIISNNKVFFDEGISTKMSVLEDNLGKITQENYVKIYNKLNESIDSFENSIEEKSSKNKDILINSINSIQEEVGLIVENIKILKENFKNVNEDFSSKIQAPIESALKNIDTSNIEERINELSTTISQTIDDFKDAFDNLGNKMIETSAGSNIETIEKINEALESTIENIKQTKEDIVSISKETKKEFGETSLNLVSEIKALIDGFIDVLKEHENSTEKNLENIVEELGQKISNIEESILKISQDEFYRDLVDEVNQKTQENLQEVSNILNENLENTNIGILGEFEKQKECLNNIIDRMIDTSAAQNIKFDALNEKITNDSTRTVNSIESLINKNNDQNNTLINNSFTDILDKITNANDLTNSNLKNIEEKISAIPQDLNDSQITMLSEEFGNMANKLEQINLQQINNSKELMIELQRIITDQGDKNEVLQKILQYANLLKDLEEKIERAKIANTEQIQSLRENFEQINSKATENLHEILDEIHMTSQKQIINEDNSKIIMEDIKDKIENYSQELRTNVQECANNINLKTEQIETFQNNFGEEIHKMFEKQTRIFSAAFQKTLNAQNPKDFSLALERIYSKLNTISTAPKSEDDEYDYTLKDVESDLAKLRLTLEKNQNLEVNQHLSALRNTIGDTVKVNQNVDQQLSYVNNWLRTAAKTMEILARKVDKTEKTNNSLNELRDIILNAPTQTNTVQSIDTSDIEHAMANTFKKFKIQEMKLESIEDKINSFLQKANDEPDIKGFINALYENMAQTKALNNRMDSIEIQLNGLQRNMEKIITYIEE